jgi:hypothetical protein
MKEFAGVITFGTRSMPNEARDSLVLREWFLAKNNKSTRVTMQQLVAASKMWVQRRALGCSYGASVDAVVDALGASVESTD